MAIRLHYKARAGSPGSGFDSVNFIKIPAGGQEMKGRVHSLCRADLHGLHAGLCFGPGFKDAVVDNGSCGRRLLIHHDALLRRRITDNVVFSGNRRLRKG